MLGTTAAPKVTQTPARVTGMEYGAHEDAAVKDAVDNFLKVFSPAQLELVRARVANQAPALMRPKLGIGQVWEVNSWDNGIFNPPTKHLVVLVRGHRAASHSEGRRILIATPVKELVNGALIINFNTSAQPRVPGLMYDGDEGAPEVYHRYIATVQA